MTGLTVLLFDLNTLVERAAEGGVDMLTIVEDPGLLATAMEALYVKEPRCDRISGRRNTRRRSCEV